jgi:protein sprouty family protein 2
MEDNSNSHDRRISNVAASRYARTTLAPVHAGTVVPPPPRIPAGGGGGSHHTSPSHMAPVAPPRPHPRPPPMQIITLDGVRPDWTRPRNEYVDAPHIGMSVELDKHDQLVLNNNTSNHNRERHLLRDLSTRVPPIFHQPTSTVKAKDLSTVEEPSRNVVTTVTPHSHPEGKGEDIMCKRCGKCRCNACTQPRELPSTWICDKKINCSAQTVVDSLTCMCVVQSALYHCVDSGEEECATAEEPCSCCERPHCLKRWGIIGALLPCLPCLCLYPPLKCGVCMITGCYNKCTRRGCTCSRERLASHQRRLLVDSESSSA